MSRKLLLMAIVVVFAAGLGTVTAYTTVDIDRSHSGWPIKKATGGTDTIITITEYDPVQAGQTSVKMMTITNNYDRTMDFPLELDSNKWHFSATGDKTMTVTLNAGESKTVYVDLGGTGATCGTLTKTTYYYWYQGSGTNTTLKQVQQDFIVCKK